MYIDIFLWILAAVLVIAGMVGQFKDQLGDAVVAEMTKYPDFEHLEAKGRKRA